MLLIIVFVVTFKNKELLLLLLLLLSMELLVLLLFEDLMFGLGNLSWESSCSSGIGESITPEVPAVAAAFVIDEMELCLLPLAIGVAMMDFE
ncbi:hypothetical protein WICPIJ_000834 [Wickerhamomyces pijperi]|uniref:Uncharacterized protein n=1 Tax=Wickerhamomyces pijperi TaxID=599730 RepID=A0A9P8QCS9_WICPI|nr:hypothetical protein WICPIJ_000834 [Wickerhamomyces pijperi]